MGPLSLARALSEEKSGNRQRGRRRRRRRSGRGQNAPKEKSPVAESDAVERALSRFSVKARWLNQMPSSGHYRASR